MSLRAQATHTSRLATPVLVSVVLAVHVLALWALHTGLLQRAVEVVVPVVLVAHSDAPVVAPPVVKPTPPAPAPVRPMAPASVPAAPAPTQMAAPAATASVTSAAPVVPAPVSAAAAPAPVPAAAAAAAAPAPAPKLELPTTLADYQSKSPPEYPRISKRLREHGRVLVSVLIGADGVPQQAKVHTSSGFERLDQSALEAVMRWRYVPGKRGGVPETLWFQVPIEFKLGSE